MSEITLITLHLFIGRRAFRLCDGLFLPKASWVKHERSSASKQVFPLEAPRRTSALEHLGMAGNSPSPERDVLRMLFKHFRGMSRAEPSRAEPSRATFAPQKNWWGPAASGSHYRCHHPNKLLCRVHSCRAGPDGCLPTQYFFYTSIYLLVFTIGPQGCSRKCLCVVTLMKDHCSAYTLKIPFAVPHRIDRGNKTARGAFPHFQFEKRWVLITSLWQLASCETILPATIS